MGGGLESRCVGRVCGADGAVQHPHRRHDMSSSEYTNKITLLHQVGISNFL